MSDKVKIGYLINLIEEAAEVQQIASKCLRFGFDNYDPNDPDQTPNRVLLAKELGNLKHCQGMLDFLKVLDPEMVSVGEEEKEARLRKYPLIIDGAAVTFTTPEGQ